MSGATATPRREGGRAIYEDKTSTEKERRGSRTGQKVTVIVWPCAPRTHAQTHHHYSCHLSLPPPHTHTRGEGKLYCRVTCHTHTHTQTPLTHRTQAQDRNNKHKAGTTDNSTQVAQQHTLNTHRERQWLPRRGVLGLLGRENAGQKQDLQRVRC